MERNVENEMDTGVTGDWASGLSYPCYETLVSPVT